MPTDPPRHFDRNRLPPGVAPTAPGDPEQIGPYRIVGRIGAGGMGVVHAGLDAQEGCAAVKTVHPHIAADPDFRARFAREVDLVARVDAACTPGFLGADVEAEAPWLATEYVPGLTLGQYVRGNGPLTGGRLTAFAAGSAEALTAIHAAGVVHRDLKPGNVILSPGGPKVLDFGIARAVDATALTATGGLFGTPGWIAPEQYAGEDATDRSDLFAWAGLVLFAATGSEPFGRGAVDEVARRTRTEEPDTGDLPVELAEIVDRAFAKNPADRPTAEEALATLMGEWSATQVEPPAETEPTRVVPVLLEREWRGISAPDPVPTGRRYGRARWFAAAAGALVLVVLVSAVLGLRGGDSPGGGAGEEADGGEGEASGEQDEPAVQTDPEDIGAVIADAVAVASGAESFDARVARHTNETGDRAIFSYRYTEDPEPAYSETMLAEGRENGYTAFGPDLDDLVGISELPEDEGERVYYRDDELADVEPMDEWEREVDRLESVAAEDAEVEYQGHGQVPADIIPEDTGPENPRPDSSQRPGHHYTGTMPDVWWDREQDEVEFDLWIGDNGHPVFLETVEYTDEVTTQPAFGPSGEEVVLEYQSRIDFAPFDGPVEIERPDESEIQDGAPDG
ncbi:serine/threonine protein kinase [Nocardiopsis sp. HNM0947]|uniref:Serine/threonine protein kinase n=1 Tax=Nocardiopsis coralli TaxID=2772213 RepID=A0ABR9P6G3_9ACTN|nr:serine/threonine-protein kinase [Nocardiopsis coralli]MBE2999285.1 serine/threonine protein kinase [Nocardiopsis coralli]